MAMRRYFDPYKLSPLQRAFLIPYFSIGSVLDPTKGDRIAGLGDVTSFVALPKLKRKMMETVSGRSLLREKPLITMEGLNIPLLKELPANTLGRKYVDYMETHNYSADERSIVRFMTDPELAYVLVRYRQVHDFWHALSDMPPTVMGELVLKCFEFEITGLPVALLSGLFGQLKLTPYEISLLWTIYIPWARKAGKLSNAALIVGYEYEKNLTKTVDEIRSELNLIIPPPLPHY